MRRMWGGGGVEGVKESIEVGFGEARRDEVDCRDGGFPFVLFFFFLFLLLPRGPKTMVIDRLRLRGNVPGNRVGWVRWNVPK